MDLKRSSEEDPEVVEPKIPKICYMLEMPNEVLVHLFKHLHPGSPEKFAVCCKRLHTLYLDHENQLLLPGALQRLHLVIRPHDEDEGVEFEVYKRNQENLVYKSLEDPSFNRIKRLLSYTESLEIEPIFMYPVFCKKGTEEYKKLREHLKTCDVQRATIRGMNYMRGSTDFIEMFEKKPRLNVITRAELLEPEKDGVMGKVESLEIYSSMSSALVKGFLEDRKITNFSAVPNEYIPFEEYINEWKEGKREIMSYEFRYINRISRIVADQTFERDLPGAFIKKLSLRTSRLTTQVANVFVITISPWLRP